MGKPVLISKLQDMCYHITVYRCRALKPADAYLHVLVCSVPSRYPARGGVYVRHCSVELRKQVLPRLTRPAPTRRGADHSSRTLENG